MVRISSIINISEKEGVFVSNVGLVQHVDDMGRLLVSRWQLRSVSSLWNLHAVCGLYY